MGRRVKVDLHVHSALSPCGGEEMKPPGVLLTAERRGVRILGIADHSTAGNAWAFVEAAEAFDVRVFVGLEVESAEGVHLLALFDTLDAVMDMDAVVAAHLPGLPNNERLFGEQHLLDEMGRVVGKDKRLLVAGTDLSIEQLAKMAGERGGMSLAAHVDRPTNGLLPVLGFVPPDLQVQAFEVSPHMDPDEARRRWPELRDLPLVTASDAHYLEDIGWHTTCVSQELAVADVGALEWGRLLAAELTSGAN